MKQALFYWSGGKDSALALQQVLSAGEWDVKCLLTSVNEHVDRVSMHEVRTSLLEAQAASIGIPLKKVLLPEMPSMERYDRIMGDTLREWKDQGVDYAIFGDIFLEDLRRYREQQLAQVSMKAVFPLWQRNTGELLREFIDKGFKAVVVCINAKYLDPSFAGRFIDDSFLEDLPAGVDPCGENGEYHSFVFDGPVFSYPVPFGIGELTYHSYQPAAEATPAPYDTGFYFRDLLPAGR